MKSEALYKDLAKYYDLIYTWKNYKSEANKIKTLIKKNKKSKGNDLLEVACGTGKHLQYLKNNYNSFGTDISKKMVQVAKKNVKGCKFAVGDMTKLNLKKEYDVILCLFSSIGYVKTYKNLEKTLKRFFDHLKPGGVLIFDPWFDSKSFKPGHLHMTTYDGDDIKIARLSDSKKSGNISIIEFSFLISKKNKKVEYFKDRHELGLFENDKTLKIMKRIGFNARFLKNGLMRNRGLFIGKKTS